jgi:hypothetical protein
MLLTLAGGYTSGFFQNVAELATRLERVETSVSTLETKQNREKARFLEWSIQFDNRLDAVEKGAARAEEWWKSADGRLERIERKLDQLRR